MTSRPTPDSTRPNELPSPDDGDLSTTGCIRRARGGDLESLERIVAQMTPLLVVQARERLGPRLASRIDPEDVVQEAWQIAFARLNDLESRSGRLGPVLFRFLATTITNRINGHLRRAIRESVMSDDELEAAPAAPDGPGARDDVTVVVSRAIRAEDGDRLRSLLESLSDDERRVVTLRAVEGVPNAVAARFLGVPPNTLAQRYKRLLERLRQELAPSVLDELVEE